MQLYSPDNDPEVRAQDPDRKDKDVILGLEHAGFMDRTDPQIEKMFRLELDRITGNDKEW